MNGERRDELARSLSGRVSPTRLSDIKQIIKTPDVETARMTIVFEWENAPADKICDDILSIRAALVGIGYITPEGTLKVNGQVVTGPVEDSEEA